MAAAGEPGQKEIIAATLVGPERQRDIVASNMASRRVDERAQAIIRRVEETSGREALELATREPSKPGIERIFEQLGATERNEQGNINRTGENLSRYQEGKKAALAVEKYLLNGYGGLTPNEKTSMRNWFLAEASRARPDLAEELTNLSSDEKQARAERFLNSGEGVEKIGKFFDSISELELLETMSVVEAEQKYIEAKKAEERKEDEYRKKQTERDGVGSKIASFDSSQEGIPGTKAHELKQKKDALPENIETELETWNQELKERKSELGRLEREREQSERYGTNQGRRSPADLDPFISQQREKVREAQGKVNERTKKIKEIADLEIELVSLQNQEKELDKEVNELQGELDSLVLEARSRNINFEVIKTERIGKEKELLEEIETIVSRATNEYLNDEVQKIAVALKEDIEATKTAAKDERQKAFVGWLTDRQTEPARAGILRRETTRIKKDVLEQDYRSLLQEGPEDLLVEGLRQQNNPETNRRYTIDEAKEFLKNNPETAKEMRLEATKQLLARKFITSGIRAEELHTILTGTTWGREAIDQALEANDSFRSKMESLYGKDAIQNRTFWERFKAAARKQPWWALLLILGGLIWAGQAVQASPAEQAGIPL